MQMTGLTLSGTITTDNWMALRFGWKLYVVLITHYGRLRVALRSARMIPPRVTGARLVDRPPESVRVLWEDQG